MNSLRPQAPGSYSAISVLLSFPAEPGWLSVLSMKLLNAAVFFILVPTLMPALDPLSASVFMGGAAVAWQLLSPHSWLRCSLLECCSMKDTLNLSGEAVARGPWAKLSVGPADGPSQGEGFLFNASLPWGGCGKIRVTAHGSSRRQRPY